MGSGSAASSRPAGADRHRAAYQNRLTKLLVRRLTPRTAARATLKLTRGRTLRPAAHALLSCRRPLAST